MAGEREEKKVKEIGAKLVAEGLKVGIVVSRFNDFLTRQLLEGAVDCMVRHGGSDDDITVAWVPGANELPQVVERMAARGGLDAVIAVGAVVQGATPHADLINTQVSRSLAATAAAHGLPVINGVVCAGTLEQAIERCGTKAGNKGWQAAQAAIEMANLFKQLA
jgi:6,7-dimethyl-8-ribityllumazine synthase